MAQGEDPGRLVGPRPERGQLAWSILLNGVLVGAFVLGFIPIIAIVHGFIDLVAQSKIRSGGDWAAYGFAFTGLLLGAIFFAYAVKYYLSTVMVLLTTLVGGPRNGNGNGSKTNGNGLSRINGNGNGYHLDLGYHPFVSVHVAAYNEKRVIERLLNALSQLEYPEYEVVVVDDSTDESVQILAPARGRRRAELSVARAQQVRELADRSGASRVRRQLHDRASFPGRDRVAEDDRGHGVHDPRRRLAQRRMGHQHHRRLGADPEALCPRIQSHLHAVG
ncbi:MAG: glycosyltransferase [Chloroflexi bacterium]|nr:MAG: glycosyltransferase [Chloroflexota bacterium]